MALTRERRAGDVIHEKMKCGSCGYILKSLRVGDQCPECGDPIAPVEIASHWSDRILPWEHIDKLILVVIVAALVVPFAFHTKAKTSVITFLVAGATVFLLIGLRGLKSGVLVLKPRYAEEKLLTGRAARLGSLFPLALSLCFIIIALLFFMDIIH
ncbi:MAG: hypothetical protein HZA51_01830 [Planctomycetes bacterium]|nr:hypothetical protein [Planctomycetota bacterium]